MSKSSLKARLGRLGPVQAIRRGSGSPATLIVRRVAKSPRTIDASIVLAESGLSLLRAKRVVEHATTGGEAIVELPAVSDLECLVRALEQAGYSVATPHAPSAQAIATTLRRVREHLALTQQEFAVKYGFTVDALQNWEQERRPAAPWLLAYLHMIEKDPRAAAEVLEDKL